MPDKLRTFIAIELPEETQKKLAELAGALKNPQDKVTWVSSGNIHLTLKFLGDVSANDIESVRNIIQDVAKVHSSFEVSIKGTGVFPDPRFGAGAPRSPRVVWVGVDTGKEVIKDIYAGLEEKLVSIGIPKEERSFTPHLTLGRVKYIKDIKGFAQNISKHKEDLIGNIRVDSISLIKSTLTPKGAVYDVLYRIHFMSTSPT